MLLLLFAAFSAAQTESPAATPPLADVCQPACAVPTTSCGTINYFLAPDVNTTAANLNSTSSINQLTLLPAACKAALSTYICLSTFVPCSPTRGCRPVCTDVRTTCASFLALFPPNIINDLNCPTWPVAPNCFDHTAPETPQHIIACDNSPAPLLSVANITAVSGLPQSEVEALVALYSTTSGNVWGTQVPYGPWPGDNDACQWYGVVCSAGHVVSISLHDVGLVGSLPVAIGQLPLLTTLDLGSNFITGSIPTSIGGLTALLLLDLSENQLTGTIPRSIGSLTNLEHLILGRPFVSGFNGLQYMTNRGIIPTNRLSGTIPSEIGNLVNLISFSVAENLLTGSLPPYALANLHSLTHLNLASNPLSGDSSFLSRLSALQVLDLVSTNFRYLPPLSNTTKVLLIASCLELQNYPSNLAQMSQLLTFYASSCSKLAGNASDLASLRLLEYLTVDSTLIAGDPQLCNMPNLLFYNAHNTPNMRVPWPVAHFNCLPPAVSVFVAEGIVGGAIPPGIFGMSNALFFALNHSPQMTGTIPPQVASLTSASLFSFEESGISGPLPSQLSALQFLENFYITNSGASGDISLLCSIRSLKRVILSSTNINGTLPACFGDLYQLEELSIPNTQVRGSIPSALAGLSTLKKLDFSGLGLTGTVPPVLSAAVGLRNLGLGGNSLTGDATDVLLSLRDLPQLGKLDLSGNNFYGELTSDAFFSSRTFDFGFTSLFSLNLAGNNISGGFELSLINLAQLSSLDLSDNQFTGPLPQDLNFDFFSGSGNKFVATNVNTTTLDKLLPASWSTTSNYISRETDTREGVVCPVLIGSTASSSVSIDPSYYGYRLCKCAPGYYGENGNCKRCPDIDTTICPGGNEIIVRAGYYPSPSLTDIQGTIRCTNSFRTQTACNPLEKSPFECAAGSTGRACSQCEKGWYRAAKQCQQCVPVWSASFPFIALAVMVSLVYFMLFNADKLSEHSGLVKNLMFYIQTLGLLLGTSSDWVAPLWSLSDITLPFSLTAYFQGLECASDSFNMPVRALVLFLVPFFFLAIFLVMMFYGLTVVRITRLRDWPDFRDSNLYVMLWVLNAAYFPISSAALSAFGCTKDPFVGKFYLDSAPYVECSSSDPEYHQLVIIASLAIVFFVIGVPTLSTYLLYLIRDEQGLRRWKLKFSFLYTMYRPGVYWFEVMIFVRRFFLALFVALLPQDSAILPLMIFALVILFTFINVIVSPNRTRIANVLDILALMCIQVTFFASVIFGNEIYDGFRVGLAVIVFTLNILCIIIYLYFIAGHYYQLHKRRNTNTEVIQAVDVVVNKYQQVISQLAIYVPQAVKDIGNDEKFQYDISDNPPPDPVIEEPAGSHAREGAGSLLKLTGSIRDFRQRAASYSRKDKKEHELEERPPDDEPKSTLAPPKPKIDPPPAPSSLARVPSILVSSEASGSISSDSAFLGGSSPRLAAHDSPA